MPDTILLMKQDNQDNFTINNEHVALARNLEYILARAQPRLARFASSQGVGADAIDDVVQETLVEAWQHLEQLRQPDRFDAWLNGICRNVCLRWARNSATTSRKQVNFSDLPVAQGETGQSAIEIPDSFDLTEELSRQDLAVLLDRAMGYLPATTREALEMHYLAEVPQSEIARRLGLTINALEVRLHRARRQLRQVLSSELRQDAALFGLALDEEMAQEWRKSSLWCFTCGQHHMLGLFEPMPDGGINLRMRCPGCSPPDDFDIVSTGGITQFDNLRSFRPALKRALQIGGEFYRRALAQQNVACPVCGRMAKMRGVEAYTTPFPFLQRFYVLMECADHGICAAGVASVCLSDPAAQQFLAHHPRCIIEPEQAVEYAGTAAIRIALVDIGSAAKLYLFAHRHSLEILGSHIE